MTEKFQSGYIKNCPQRLPAGFIDWIRTDVLPQDHTLLYKKGGWRGMCYVCGRKVRAQSQTQRFAAYMTRTCPDCGARVNCYLSGGAAWKEDKVSNVVCAQTDKNGVLWFRMFHLMRDYTAKYNNIKGLLEECARYALKENATGYWERYHKYQRICGAYEEKLDNWYQNGRFNIYDGEYIFYPGADREFFSKTHLKYFEPNRFLELSRRGYFDYNGDIIKYAHLCSHYKVMEFLIKNEFFTLIRERMAGGKEINKALLWQRKNLKECFRFPLRILKEIDSVQWSTEYLTLANELIKILPPEKITYDILTSGYAAEHLLKALKYMSFAKYKNKVNPRLELQYKTKYDEQMYYDYLIECEKLKLDLKSDAVLFPKNLTAAHERTSSMVEYEENKEMFEKFKKVSKSLEKNCFKAGEFLIRPAESPTELKHEGKALCHCVGGYADRMAKKQTAIYFVRKADEPDKPYFTLELQGTTVVQCRTLHNRSYETEPSVKEFVDTWVKNVIKKSKVKKSA